MDTSYVYEDSIFQLGRPGSNPEDFGKALSFKKGLVTLNF